MFVDKHLDMETWWDRPRLLPSPLGCSLASRVWMKKLSSWGACPVFRGWSAHGVLSTNTCDSQMICKPQVLAALRDHA